MTALKKSPRKRKGGTSNAKLTRSKCYRDLIRFVRQSRALVKLARELAEQVPGAAKAGLFDNVSIGPHVVRDLEAVDYIVGMAAGLIESDLPPPDTRRRKRGSKR
jgi:hypothetical protein